MSQQIFKNVPMIDNRGQNATGVGILSSDKRFVVACIARSYVGPWKASATGSGNDARPIGFGDINVFTTENIKTLADGSVTADLRPFATNLGFRAMEIRDQQGNVSESINTTLDDTFGQGKNQKKIGDIFPKEVTSIFSAAIKMATKFLTEQGPARRMLNAELSEAASDLARMAANADKKRAKATTSSPVQAVGGVTPASVLEESAI
jgi:hypothetical protein